MGNNQICSICNRCDLNNEVDFFKSKDMYPCNKIDRNLETDLVPNGINQLKTGNCTNLTTNKTTLIHQTIDKDISLSNLVDYRTPYSKLLKCQLLNAEVHQLIKLQSSVRSYLLRRNLKKKLGNKNDVAITNFGQITGIEFNPNLKQKHLGNRKNSHKFGFGMMFMSDGCQYFGNFENDKMNGVGKFTHINLNIYFGDILDDMANGYGVFIGIDNSKYEGYWKKDLAHYIGVESLTDSSFYQGEYSEGLRNGYGSFIWTDGNRYDGEWHNNLIDGIGIYTFIDGRQYIGEWRSNVMHGYGEFSWPEGKKYMGFYQNEKKSGFGIYIWKVPIFRVYVGFWEEGLQSGVGKLINIRKEVGQAKESWCHFENGKRTRKYKSKEEAVCAMAKDQLKYLELFDADQNLFLADATSSLN